MDTLLAVRRLSYFGRLMGSAPPQLAALLQAAPRDSGWLGEVMRDLAHFHNTMPQLAELPQPTQHTLSAWEQLAAAHPRPWAQLVKLYAKRRTAMPPGQRPRQRRATASAEPLGPPLPPLCRPGMPGKAGQQHVRTAGVCAPAPCISRVTGPRPTATGAGRGASWTPTADARRAAPASGRGGAAYATWSRRHVARPAPWGESSASSPVRGWRRWRWPSYYHAVAADRPLHCQ